jgi:hypothetical protein
VAFPYLLVCRVALGHIATKVETVRRPTGA